MLEPGEHATDVDSDAALDDLTDVYDGVRVETGSAGRSTGAGCTVMV
jgi:hypothetical protein